MKAILVSQKKAIDDLGNILEITIWELPEPSKDKPHGFKYSLVYIVNGVRVIGYDNAEGKGDHRHYGNSVKPYKLQSIDKLLDDFYKDVRRFGK